MRPLRYSINVTLDRCSDHRAIVADEELRRRAAENLAQADALLFGRMTYDDGGSDVVRGPVNACRLEAWTRDFVNLVAVLLTSAFVAFAIASRQRVRVGAYSGEGASR